MSGQIVLRYRHLNQGEDYQQVAMIRNGGQFAARIPGTYSDSDYALACYFIVRAGAGDVDRAGFGADTGQLVIPRYPAGTLKYTRRHRNSDDAGIQVALEFNRRANVRRYAVAERCITGADGSGALLYINAFSVGNVGNCPSSVATLTPRNLAL